MAAVASVSPVGATARTRKTCAPTATLRPNGELQGLNLPLSSLHSKPEPAWSALKVNFASRFGLRFAGCLPSAVAGATAPPAVAVGCEVAVDGGVEGSWSTIGGRTSTGGTACFGAQSK